MSTFSFKNTVDMMKSSFRLEGDFLNPTNLSSPLGTVVATAAGSLEVGGFHYGLNVGASMDAANMRAPHGVMKRRLQLADDTTTAVPSRVLHALGANSHVKKGPQYVVVQPRPVPKPDTNTSTPRSCALVL